MVPVTSCAQTVMNRRRKCEPTFADICSGTNVLRKVLEFLDSSSLMSCRQVSKEWEESSRTVLMEHHELNLNAWSSESLCRMQLFSSWKVEVYDRERSEQFWNATLQKFGQSVTSLHIVGLTSEWTSIVRGALTLWCPNLQHIRFGSGAGRSCPLELVELEEFCNILDRTTSVEEFRAILRGTELPVFQPFPDIANIHTVTMEWNSVYYRMPAVFPMVVFNIIKSCPRLKHLFLWDLEPSLTANTIEDSRFGIVMHLARHPNITKNLETFAWRIKSSRYYDSATVREGETQPLRFATANPNVPPIRFGSCLRSLHWDVMHIDRNGGVLLPGILSQGDAVRNLNKLSSNRIVLDCSRLIELQGAPFNTNANARRRWVSRHLWRLPIMTVRCPTLPHLVELSISMDVCRSVCLSDLVHAVPHLKKLVINEFQPNLPPYPQNDGELIEILTPTDRPIVQHQNLQFLELNIRLRSPAVVGNVALKFPNLEELWIGYSGIWHGNFEMPAMTLVDNLTGLSFLKRFQLRMPNYMNMVHLIEHIAYVKDRLSWIEMYHMRFIPCWGIVGHTEYVQRRRELHARLRRSCNGTTSQVKVSWLNSVLLGRHEMYRNSLEEETLRTFMNFLKQHRLPIELKRSQNTN
jgi:hypothetical protein